MVVAVPLSHADPVTANLEVTKVDIKRTMPPGSPVSDAKQAGAHPDTSIYFAFCDQGVTIASADNTTPIRITLSTPVPGLTTAANVVIRGAEGNTAINGLRSPQPVGTDNTTSI